MNDLRPTYLLLNISDARLTGLEVFLRRFPNKPPHPPYHFTDRFRGKVRIIEALLLGAHGVVPKQSASRMLFKSIRTVMAGEFWVSRDMVSDLVETLRGAFERGMAGHTEDNGPYAP